MRPRVRSIGVQCNGTDIPLLPRPDREPARNEPLSSSEESSETDSDHGSVYEPSSTGSEESQIQDDQKELCTQSFGRNQIHRLQVQADGAVQCLSEMSSTCCGLYSTPGSKQW
nr:uncharacterized protein LOC117685796 [Crassostrea gigas]